MNTYYAETRAEWRAWLARHHRAETEVFLVFFKKCTGKPTLTYDAAVEEALCVGWIDGVKKRLDDERYVYRFTPRKPRSRWSASNKERVARLTATGRMKKPGLTAIAAAKANGAWDDEPDAERHHEMPDELTRGFARSAAARRFFEALPPGQQRNTVAWIASARKPETRARRAALAVEAFEAGKRLW